MLRERVLREPPLFWRFGPARRAVLCALDAVLRPVLCAFDAVLRVVRLAPDAALWVVRLAPDAALRVVRFAPDAAVRVVRLAPAVVLRAAFAVFAAAVRAAPCPLVFAFDPAERELERVVELVRERADDDEDPLRERLPRAEPEVLLLLLPDFVRARAISVSSFV